MHGAQCGLSQHKILHWLCIPPAKCKVKCPQFALCSVGLMTAVTHVDDQYHQSRDMLFDFRQCGILTSVDSDEPLQPPFKLRNSK